jgi:GNAT superfamily N-acetyltransferase
MYKEYVKERENLKTLEIDGKGFICYRMEISEQVNICFISDYYVLPKFRKQGIGYKLADMVFSEAKKAGCERVFCQSDEKAKGHDISKLTILKYGFKEYHIEKGIHHYYMEVSAWEKQ